MRMLAAVVAFLLMICGAEAQQFQCTSSVTKTISSATDTQLVAAPAQGTSIYICDYEFSFNGTGNAYLETATTGTCGGTLAAIGNTWYGVANLGKAAANQFYRGMSTGSLQLCVNTSGAVNFSITVYYTVQ